MTCKSNIAFLVIIMSFANKSKLVIVASSLFSINYYTLQTHYLAQFACNAHIFKATNLTSRDKGASTAVLHTSIVKWCYS
uniref:Uncharacterized protein n=1 Tax=Glossina palpalis gambiensis TaxID=67801 RepID=A0A1B0BFY7_9MUSC